LRAYAKTNGEPHKTNGVAAGPVVVAEELPEGRSKVVTVGDTEVAVFRHQGALYAIQNRCPHEKGALADGELEGDEVVCPLHGYCFNVKTGACSTDPKLRARTFKLIPGERGFTVEL